MTDEIFRTAQGPRVSSLLNPVALVRNLWARHELLFLFARRDLIGKYRGSDLGILWTVISPLLLLVVYTFVFSVILKLKLGGTQAAGHGTFAINMFIALLVFNLFAEVTNRAPHLVLANPNYVKKVVFPLEILVPAILLSSLATMGVGLLVWLAGRIILIGWFGWTALLLPVVVLPICLTTLGLGWFLAALGLFVRDVGHTVVVLVQVLFLLTPIFYSLQTVENSDAPAFCVSLIRLNPLTQAAVQARLVMLENGVPDWTWWSAMMIFGTVMTVTGYAFFMKSRRAFGDVI